MVIHRSTSTTSNKNVTSTLVDRGYSQAQSIHWMLLSSRTVAYALCCGLGQDHKLVNDFYRLPFGDPTALRDITSRSACC
jgi:hypothetical protein